MTGEGPDRVHLTSLGRFHFDDPMLYGSMPGAPTGVTYWDVLLAWEESTDDTPRSVVIDETTHYWRRSEPPLSHFAVLPDGSVLVNVGLSSGSFQRVHLDTWTRAAAAEQRSRMGADIVGIIPADEITDPRARALDLRRTRNVGPDGRTPAGRKRRT